MAGGQGHIDLLMTLGTAGSLLHVSEKSALRPGVRPICQATKLLDSHPMCAAWRNKTPGHGPVGQAVPGTHSSDSRIQIPAAIDCIWRCILEEAR